MALLDTTSNTLADIVGKHREHHIWQEVTLDKLMGSAEPCQCTCGATCILSLLMFGGGDLKLRADQSYSLLRSSSFAFPTSYVSLLTSYLSSLLDFYFLLLDKSLQCKSIHTL